MKTMTINGFAYCKPAESYHKGDVNVIDGFRYYFNCTSVEGWGDGYINAGEAQLIITLPEGFDPRGGAVKALEEQKRELMAEFQKRITQIDEQINRFTALEMA